MERREGASQQASSEEECGSTWRRKGGTYKGGGAGEGNLTPFGAVGTRRLGAKAVIVNRETRQPANRERGRQC